MGNVLLKRQRSFSGKLTRLFFVSGKPGFGSDGGLFREPIGDLTGPVYRKSKILTGLLKGRWYQG